MEIGVTKAVQDKIKTKLVESAKDTQLVFCRDTHFVTKTHGRKSVGGINRMVICMKY